MSKNIVICFDGTSNELKGTPTNVLKLFNLVLKDPTQIAFYDPGVGTFSPAGLSTPKVIGEIMGKAFGAGLTQNIKDGYSFLMEHYEVGDKVFVFGFSRGAFTARAFGGLLGYFGLLHRHLGNLIDYALTYYNTKQLHLGAKFQSDFGRACPIECIGVWDTVGSLGYITGKDFFDIKLGTHVKHGFHAMAIDECRAKFPVSLWDENHMVDGQTIEQVWFAGVHSDVGGGYKQTGLGDIALQWMVAKAISCGLKTNNNWQDDLKCNPLAQMHNSRTGLWKLWAKAPRPIPQDALIHTSVQERLEQSHYKPNNLKSYKVVS